MNLQIHKAFAKVDLKPISTEKTQGILNTLPEKIAWRRLPKMVTPETVGFRVWKEKVVDIADIPAALTLIKVNSPMKKQGWL